MGLTTWNKPSFACLAASRFPYGEEITAERLARVERAERYLLDLGFAYVALDLLGYCTGSMNETLTAERRAAYRME